MSVIKPEMVAREITRHDILPMSFLKKSAYTGSKRGLRYRMAKTEKPAPQSEAVNASAAENEENVEQITVLRLWTWSSKLSFDNTPEEEFHIKDFEFSDSGIEEGLEFLNEELTALESKGIDNQSCT